MTSAQTLDSMSATACRHGRLIRTTTWTPSRASRAAAARTMPRASTFWSGGMLSSRSSWMTSAPRLGALARKRSLLTGTNSIDRQIGSVLLAKVWVMPASPVRVPPS
jgi:hypothetical protein